MLKVVERSNLFLCVLMFSLFEISRFLLGFLGFILVDFGALLGACWEQFGYPLERVGSLWASSGLLLRPLAPFAVPLGLLWSHFGTLALLAGSFRTASGPF